MNATLSIVIVNWNSRDYLRRCLGVIAATCADLSPKVIVVDGASFDGCAEMVAAEFPSVTFIQSPTNIGFGQCNNLGFAEVKGDAVLLLNPDTEVRSGAVRLLLEEMAVRPKAGLLAPRLFNSDGSLQTSCVQALPTPWNQALDSNFLRRLFPRSNLWGVSKAFFSTTPVEVDAVSGACMLLPAGVFRRLGGFSSDYFMYGEDIDLCLRVRRAGLQVLHVPACEVVHHGGGSSSQQVSDFSTILIRDTNSIYMRRNHGPGTAVMYRGLQGLSAVIRILLAALPACILPMGEIRRKSARDTINKWVSVLRWALDMNPARIKVSAPAFTNAARSASNPEMAKSPEPS